MIDFSLFPLGGIYVVSVVALFIASEVGHRLGVNAVGEANVTTLEASTLGLLALMMSFTFSMALSRYDARIDAMTVEANAIGTAALRARLLPAPQSRESLKLFRDYIQVRIDLIGVKATPDVIGAAVARSNAIQNELWRLARDAAAKDNGMVPTGLYLVALNETFDDQAKRLVAARNRVPNIVLAALYVIAIVAMGFCGYASAIDKRRWRSPVYVMSVLVAGVILLIQDIDRPREGYVSVNQRPMTEAAASITSYLSEFENVKPVPRR